MREQDAAVNGFWMENAPAGFRFDAFSSREPAPTSLENATNEVEQDAVVTP
jgi:hypothetical protein